MFGYFIRAFSFALFLSFVIVSSYAADKIQHSDNLKIDFVLSKMTSASKLYTQACNLAQAKGPTPKQKQQEEAVQSFTNVIEMMRQALNDISPNNYEIYNTCVQMQAISERQLGILSFNKAVETLGDPKKVSESSIDLMRDALQHIEKSFKLYASINDKSNILITSQSLVPSLETFATLCALRAEIETRPTVVVGLYEDCLTSKQRNNSLREEQRDGQPENVSLYHIQLLAIHKMLRLYSDIGCVFDDLCKRLKQKDNLAPFNHTFKTCSTDTASLIKFWEAKIVNSNIDLTLLPQPPRQKQASPAGRGQNPENGTVSLISPFFDLLKELPPVLNAEDFLEQIRTLQCGILWGVYQEDISNELSQKVAYASYKKYVYQGEFASDSSLEEAFIFAQLADLIGNSEPLNCFYKDLHARRKQARRQKMVDAIKADLKARQIEKEKRAAMAAEQLKPVSQASSQSSSARSAPSSHYEYSPSDLPAEEVAPLRIKKKTRGVPSTQNDDEVESIAQEESILSKEDAQFILSPVVYEIYQKINKSEKITIKEAIMVLKAFKCQIEDGAKHKKATAPNGKVWTIPFHSQREGPIDRAYRRTLRNFLHISLEIDPEDVVIKK